MQKLKIWHITNIPNKPFEKEVSGLHQAKEYLDLLADYNLFLGDMIVSNVQGLIVFDGNEWEEWEDEFGDNIDDTYLVNQQDEG